MHLPLPTRLRAVPRRWWVMLLVVAVGLVGGGWTWLSRGDAADTERITATVTRGTYKSTVSATGTITPRHEADLSFSSSGAVDRVAVAVGDKVTKGQVLASIDTASLQAQVDAAQAQLTAARAQLAEDSDASSTQRTADAAAVASAESDLEAAEESLSDATLRAPFNGTVSAVGYAVGDAVGATKPSSDSTSGDAAAITVISPRALQVDASVPASDVSKVKKGMQVEITPTGGGEVAYGTVAEVGVIASASDSGAAQFPVTVQVTGRPTGLYAGSTADLAITVRQATDVLAVSTAALHMEGDTPYVYLIQGSKRVKRDVKIGQTYGAQTEILSGIAEGDVVEVASFTAPRTGDRTQGPGGTFQGPPGGFDRSGSGGNQPPVVIEQGR